VTRNALGAAALRFAAALFLPLGLLAPAGMWLLLLIAGAGALIASPGRWRDHGLGLPTLAGAGLLAWAALSLAWTPDPGQAAVSLAKLAGLMMLAAALLAGVARTDPSDAAKIAGALAATLVLGLILMTADIAASGAIRRAVVPDSFAATDGLYGYNRGATVAALAVWPALLWLWPRSQLLALALLLWVLAILAGLESASAAIGYSVGLAAFAAVVIRPRPALAWIGIIAAVAVLTAPLLPFTILSPQVIGARVERSSQSAMHRLYIWRFAAEHIAERPLAGWGYESARAFPGRRATIADFDRSRTADVYKHLAILPLHPHNGPLHIWLELGLPGALIMAALVGWIPFAIRRLAVAPVRAAALAGAFTSALGLCGFSYGLWQSWWLSALALAAAIAILAARSPE